MKKTVIVFLCIVLALSLIGCGDTKPVKIIEGNIKSYSEMADGTWECNGYKYKYKLEITGRMNNSESDTAFVYLSNLEEITFEQARNSAGFSSNTNDYFEPSDAILVELR